MSQIIEVTVSPQGETTVQTRGFAGGDCLDASRFLEQALGVTGLGRDLQDRRVLPGPGRRPGPQAVAVALASADDPRPEGGRVMPDAVFPPRPWLLVEGHRRGHPRRTGREVDAYPGHFARPRGPTRSTAPSGPSSARSWRQAGVSGDDLPGPCPGRSSLVASPAAGGRGPGMTSRSRP